MKPDDDQPGVGPPDVEPGRFANFMSVHGVDAFKRFTPLKPGADSTVESACGQDYLTHVDVSCLIKRPFSVLQCVAVCCSVLQCVAVCCSVLQCVAVCCTHM